MEVSRSSSIKLATKWLVTGLVGETGLLASARIILSQLRAREQDMLENGIESSVRNSELKFGAYFLFFKPKKCFCGADDVLTGCDTWCGKYESFKKEFTMNC